MSMTTWAEREIKMACKRENPDWDGESFDYGCSCYMSALKAFKSLLEDGHSGYSFSITRRILDKLMWNIPLSPITEDDFNFFIDENGEKHEVPRERYGNDRDYVSVQCPRCFHVFKYEYDDGRVVYHDQDRAYCINIEHPSDTFSSHMENVIDEMFPITMPYMPTKEQYQCYIQEFLTDKKNGDFDTQALLYIITPDNKKIEVNKFWTEVGTGEMHEITKEEYEELLTKRIDTLNLKVAENLIFTLISNSSTDSEIDAREKWYGELSDERRNEINEKLIELCEFFNDHYDLNTFHMHQALCHDEKDPEIEKHEELKKIQDFLVNDLLGDFRGWMNSESAVNAETDKNK